MTALPLRVIKLGGSLLEWPARDRAIRDWLALQSPGRNLILVGGGQAVEQLRQSALPESEAHWRAVSRMEENGRVFAGQIGFPQILDPTLSQPWEAAVLVELTSKLQEMDLPTGWHVTSDSIAASMAVRFGADELVLLKSCDANRRDPVALAAEGLVDSYFPHVASRIFWRFVNLRRV